MKKLLFLAALMILAACAQNKAPKALVLYYSQTNTTKAVAEEIAAALGADIEAILPVVPYEGDIPAVAARCAKDAAEGKLPELKPFTVDVNAYDIIFLGYPIWMGTYAPPVEAAISAMNLDGKKVVPCKKVVPFCTFGSGGLDTSTNDLKAKLPNAEILPGYGVRAARIDAAKAEVDYFLKSNGFLAGDVTPLPAFSEPQPADEAAAAIFDAAVGSYPMIHAAATEVASREVPGGIEYLFTAKDLPRDPAMEMPDHFIKVYVLAEDGKEPVFTQVLR